MVVPNTLSTDDELGSTGTETDGVAVELAVGELTSDIDITLSLSLCKDGTNSNETPTVQQKEWFYVLR